jgi:UDP-GlcNAc:undecaprenyl-phosphate GlcNAc-1-phosphate transferase
LGIFEYFTSPTCWAILLGCFAATSLLTPVVMVFAHWLGGVEGGGYRKIHKSPTPLLGGLAIAIPFIAVALASLSEKTGLFRAVGGQAWDFVVLAGGGAAITALGVFDDVRGMRARYKLLGQILIATLVAFSGYAIGAINIPLVGVISLEHFAGLGSLLTILWIVGITNAVNIIDGMDGLATGVSLIAAASLAAVAGINGSPFVVLLCVALSGSLLAFLRYNWHPARIFLGDTGSMFLGFALSTLSLMGSYKAQGAVLMLAAVMALGIPIFETIISMVRRGAAGLPIFAADAGHTHHRLLRMGMSQRQAAAVLYTGGLLCFAAAVLDAMRPKEFPASLIPSGIFIVTLFSIVVVAGYTQAIAAKFRCRQETMRHLALARYAAMTLVPGASHQTVARIMDLLCREFGLNFVAVELDGGRGRLGSADLPDNHHLFVHPRSVERFFVKASDGAGVEVIYQHSSEVSVIQRRTTAACLDQVFAGIRAELLEDLTPKAKEEELLPGIAIYAGRADLASTAPPGAVKTPVASVPVEVTKDESRIKHTN